MKRRASIVVLLFLLSACGQSPVSSTVPHINVTPHSGSSSGTSSTIAPSNNGGGAQSITVTEYSLGAFPSSGGIAIASDGSIWTESNQGAAFAAAFVRWNNGAVSAYPFGNVDGFAPFITLGFVVSNASAIFSAGSQDQGGGNTLYEPFSIANAGGSVNPNPGQAFLSGSGVEGYIADMEAFKDGSIWEAQTFPQYGPSGLGYVIEVSGGGTSIILPLNLVAAGFTYSLPTAIAQGPDGNLWVSVQNWLNAGNRNGFTYTGSAMLVYTTQGTLVHTFALTNAANAMVTGPDRALWFTNENGTIGRMSMTGTTVYYPSPSATDLTGITVGSDGALWYLEPFVNRLGRITTSGAATDYALPSANGGGLFGIIGPPNGCQPYTLWFAGAGNIAMVTYK